MRTLKLRVGVMAFAACAAFAASSALMSATFGIRYCCTTQQSLGCAAQGGTASCRTGVCQCLH